MKVPAQTTAVILAAGIGSRLGVLTKDRPKPLMEIDGKTILQYRIEWLRKLGIEKIVVIGGYKIEMIKAVIGRVDQTVVLAENKDFATTQRMASLLCAAEEIDGNLYITDGDYIFSDKVLDQMRFEPEMSIYGTDIHSDLVQADMGVEIDSENNLVTMEKDVPGYTYYFNSQAYLPARFVGEFMTLGREMVEANPMVHVEAVLIEYARRGAKIKFVNVGDPLWVEIDTPEELAIAEKAGIWK